MEITRYIWYVTHHIPTGDITVSMDYHTAVTKFTRFGMVSCYITLWNIYNPMHALLNIHNSSCYVG